MKSKHPIALISSLVVRMNSFHGVDQKKGILTHDLNLGNAVCIIIKGNIGGGYDVFQRDRLREAQLRI